MNKATTINDLNMERYRHLIGVYQRARETAPTLDEALQCQVLALHYARKLEAAEALS